MMETRFCHACGKPLPTSARLSTPPIEFVFCPNCDTSVAVMPLEEQQARGASSGDTTSTISVSRRKIGRLPLWGWAVVAIGILAATALIFASSKHGPVASATAAPVAPAADPPAQVVSAFYSDVNKHDYAAAWTLLSPSFQHDIPFARFKDGYASTQSVRAKVSPVPGAPDRVRTTLDATSLVNGASVHTHFEGYWALSWSAANHKWFLDQGHFTKTSETAAPPLTANVKAHIFENLFAYGRLDPPAPEMTVSNGTLTINFTHGNCLTGPGMTSSQSRELITYALGEAWVYYPYVMRYVYLCPDRGPTSPSVRGTLDAAQISAAIIRGESGRTHFDMSYLAPKLKLLRDGLPTRDL